MTERHLRCGADGCHFCCCCTSKSDRLGCLRRHVLWHLHNWFTLPLPPRKTILLLDELEAWEDNEIEKNKQIKNEFEKKNENNNENEDEETSSSCDGDKDEQNNENHNKATKPTVTAAGGARVPQNARWNFYVLEEHPSSVSKSKKSNQKKTKSNDGEKEVSAAVTNDGENEDSAAVINDGEKEESAAVINDGEKEESAAVNKETKAETEPKTAHGSNQEKSLNEASKKNRSMKQQRKIVQENDNLSQRKRKFVHEYINLSFKRFKFEELPDTEPPPPAPTLHQLPSQLPDFAKESKLPLHVGLPPSQVPNTLGAGTLGPYWRSYYKKKPKTKFKKKFKKKFNVKFKNKYKCHYKYYNYHEAVLNFGVYTRLVAYTRIITDSFRVFDRGRRSGHDVTAGLHPPLHLPPGEDN